MTRTTRPNPGCERRKKQRRERSDRREMVRWAPGQA